MSSQARPSSPPSPQLPSKRRARTMTSHGPAVQAQARNRAAWWNSGWAIWLAGTALLMSMSAWLLGPTPGVEELRSMVRATARSSLLCFLLAYTASAWAQLWPGRFSQALLLRRRQWGLLFFTSHLLHAMALIGLQQAASPALWASLTSTLSYALGGSGYLILSLLALSSNRRTQAWLGAARWQRWHRLGSHWLWLLFLLSNAKRVPLSASYLLPVTLLLGALILRVVAKRERIRSTPVA